MRVSWLLVPLFLLFLLWHGWGRLPLNLQIAQEEEYYKRTDPWGYLDYREAILTYHIQVVRPDKDSDWYRSLPPFMQDSAMFVWDRPVAYVNNWNQQEVDPGMTMSVVWHELVHVMGRWHPEYFVRTEGLPAPPIDINDWHTWSEEEAFASNIQLRVAKRLNTPAGVQYAKDLAHLFLFDMSQGRREEFLKVYGDWLEPEIQEMVGWVR